MKSMKSLSEYSKIILTEYKDYVRADPMLSEDTRRIRVQTADKFQGLLDNVVYVMTALQPRGQRGNDEGDW